MKTKKTVLLFLALFFRLLKIGGRAAVIVPAGVLFGSASAHRQLRQMLVEKQKLDAIISMTGGVLKPYAGVLLFTEDELRRHGSCAVLRHGGRWKGDTTE